MALGAMGYAGSLTGVTAIGPLDTLGNAVVAPSAALSVPTPSTDGGAVAGLKLRLLAGATLRVVAVRCASANGITQMATSRSTYNALRIRCALMLWLSCFFIWF